jgi:23S rRNA pseudouridine2605 synthase
MEKERLQKILSRAGLGSRRECDRLVEAGRVKVNDRVAVLGEKADISIDRIMVDNKPVSLQETDPIYFAFNKPKFVLSELKKNDERKVIADFIPVEDYLFIVGRLDYDSEGLILLTNNGDVANRLTHPRYEHEKEYLVLMTRKPDEKQLATWKRGIVLENGQRSLPSEISIHMVTKNGCWVKTILKEGKKRQIREMGKTIGLPVKRIIRKRIGPIELGDLKPGKWRILDNREISLLEKG